MVYLKLQPYIQLSLADRSHHKLAFRFFGPYRVVDKIGSVAYRLELPPSSSIHPVFHVSQLKKAVGAHHTVTKSLPSELARWSIPERILQRRVLWQGTASVVQGLVKWSNLPDSLATWEALDTLRQQFPRAKIWGHPGAQDGGSVSTIPDVAVPDTATATDEPKEGEEGKTGRQPRKTKKNARVYGPEWQTH
jgi:hypothetical protein